MLSYTQLPASLRVAASRHSAAARTNSTQGQISAPIIKPRASEIQLSHIYIELREYRTTYGMAIYCHYSAKLCSRAQLKAQPIAQVLFVDILSKYEKRGVLTERCFVGIRILITCFCLYRASTNTPKTSFRAKTYTVRERLRCVKQAYTRNARHLLKERFQRTKVSQREGALHLRSNYSACPRGTFQAASTRNSLPKPRASRSRRQERSTASVTCLAPGSREKKILQRDGRL